MNQKKIRKILLITSLFLVIPLCINLFLPIVNFNNFNENTKPGELHSADVERYNITFENPTFDGDGTPWNSIIEGDNKDAYAYIDQNQANFEIIGDQGYKVIDDPLNDTKWDLISNPDLPVQPNGLKNITVRGCEVSHTWDEDVNQTHNRPSAQWKRTINMPVDMRDYIITSASLDVVFNATVTVSPTSGGIERYVTEAVSSRFSTGDYAKFYVLLSDVDESFPPIQVAYNHTGELGRDTPSLGSYPDTPMSTIPEDVLIDVLMSVFKNDGFNFTITLGIDIYCEDNIPGVDIDTFDSLIIRSFNLSFNYKKKIDQFTTISWEQIGDEISGKNTQISHANLTFKYKADRTWPVASSPNSELRILINNNLLPETIKLSTSSTSFQPAKEDGFDLTYLILKDTNISLSIQIFLADEFTLDQNITISIDDVYFTIFYIEISSTIFSEPWFFTALLIFASILTVIIAGYFIAYQQVLKYPKPVRKTRKFKRSLNRKNDPQVLIVPRNIAFNMVYNRELSESSKLIKTSRIGSKEPSLGTSEKSLRQAEKMEPKLSSDELIDKSIEKKTELDKLINELDKK
ncbi:MAG: hypothetical protein ACFFFT_14005 [Candidatus Thorarchaeota archaeon]